MSNDRKSPLLSSGGSYQAAGANVVLPITPQHMSLQFKESNAVESSPLLSAVDRSSCWSRLASCCSWQSPPSPCCLLLAHPSGNRLSRRTGAAGFAGRRGGGGGGGFDDRRGSASARDFSSGGTSLQNVIGSVSSTRGGVVHGGAANGGTGSGTWTAATPSPAVNPNGDGGGDDSASDSEIGCNEASNPCAAYSVVVLLVIALIACSTTELVLRKVVATNLYNYRWFMTQALCLATFVVTAIASLIRRKEIKRQLKAASAPAGGAGGGSRGGGGIPTKAFLYMACLDAAHVMCLFVPIGVLSGPVSIIIPQAVIPVTLLYRLISNATRSAATNPIAAALAAGSSSSSNARASLWRPHYVIGFIAITGGVLLTCLPDVLAYHDCTGGGRSRAELVANIIILFVAVVPAVVSQSYKLKFLSKTSMDMYFMNCGVSFFQFIIGMILAPIALELQYVAAPSPPADPPHGGGSGAGAAGIGHHASDASSLASAAGIAVASMVSSAAASVGNSLSLSSYVVNDPYPIPTDTNAAYTKNIFTNFAHGMTCVFRAESHSFQDLCNSLGSTLVWEVAGYVLAVIGTQIAIGLLMRRLARESLVSWALFVGILLSFFAFYMPFVQKLLPVSDGTTCLSIDAYSAFGAVCVFAGLIIASLELPPAAAAGTAAGSTPADGSSLATSPGSDAAGPGMPEEIDVWAQFEALEAADEKRQKERREAKEREREQKERRRARENGFPPFIPPSQRDRTNNGVAAAMGGSSAADVVAAVNGSRL